MIESQNFDFFHYNFYKLLNNNTFYIRISLFLRIKSNIQINALNESENSCKCKCLFGTYIDYRLSQYNKIFKTKIFLWLDCV